MEKSINIDSFRNNLFSDIDKQMRVFKYFYPDAQISNGKPKPFKIRNEKTASTYLTEQKNKVWLKDFGNADKSKDCINIVETEKGIKFIDAVKYISKNILFTEMETKEVTTTKPKQTDFEKTIFAIKNNETKPAADYLKSRNIETDKLPADSFYYDSYQKAVVFIDADKKLINKRLVEPGEKQSKSYNKGKLKNAVYDKLYNPVFDKVYITEGVINALSIQDRSVISIFSSSNLFSDVSKLSRYISGKNVVLAFDNDKAGQKITDNYINFIYDNDIRIESLKVLKLPKGKDLNDLKQANTINTYLYEDSNYKLIPNPRFIYSEYFEFWNYEYKEKDGTIKAVKIDRNKLYKFLEANNYYKYELLGTERGYIFIHIEKNIVSEVSPVQIKDFVIDFLKSQQEIQALNKIYTGGTQILGENSLSNLSNKTLDFVSAGKDYQYMFFTDTVWKITAKGIAELPNREIKKYVWDKDVINFKPSTTSRFFDVKYNGKDKSELDKYQLKILNDKFCFFKYLINTSFTEWKKFESGKSLTDAEKKEQRLHVINKLYAIGYLLHGYKNVSKAYAVFSMDLKESDVGESNGGTGKSIFGEAIKQLMPAVTLNGKNKKLTENPHIFEQVDERTRFIFVDDVRRYFDFEYFFPSITGDLHINPKGTKQYILPFINAPKFYFASNHALRNIDGSTARRTLYIGFSDYYHPKNKFYKTERNPRSEFGKNFFSEWDNKEWNAYYNFMAQCIVLYLQSKEKINPPFKEIEKRNLKEIMGNDFLEWAKDYFTDENLDTEIKKHDALTSYNESVTSKIYKLKSHKFKKKLEAFCEYAGYIFNPSELLNERSDDPKRIMKKDTNDTSKVVEYLYIQAKENLEMPF